MHVASPAKPEGPVGDLRSAETVVFRWGGAVTTTVEPFVKAALLHPGEVWPGTVPFTELVAVARSRLSSTPAVIDSGFAGADARRLGPAMVRCYATGHVELTVLAPDFASGAGDRPRASAWARRQAGGGNRVTNARHETVRLNDLERHVLRHLDGTRDRAGLLDLLTGLVADGSLILHEQGRVVRDTSGARHVLPVPLTGALNRLAKSGLLVP